MQLWRMFVKDRPEEEQTEIKLNKGHGRNKESKRFCEVRVSNNDSQRSHGQTAAWLSEVTPSHWCEIRQVTSWFLSVEVDFIWQTNSGMTGLFPWEHICLLCGAQPKCWRGVANDDGCTGGKMNHIHDDSNLDLQQNSKIFFPLWVSFKIPLKR